jgi:hypothetical protein
MGDRFIAAGSDASGKPEKGPCLVNLSFKRHKCTTGFYVHPVNTGSGSAHSS